MQKLMQHVTKSLLFIVTYPELLHRSKKTTLLTLNSETVLTKVTHKSAPNHSILSYICSWLQLQIIMYL